jgi:hypothetical protein
MIIVGHKLEDDLFYIFYILYIASIEIEILYSQFFSNGWATFSPRESRIIILMHLMTPYLKEKMIKKIER